MNWQDQLFAAVQSRFKTIVPGAVFQLDDGPYVCQGTIKDVHPWKKTGFSKAEVPAMKLSDPDRNIKPGPVGQHESRLRFVAEVALLGGTSAEDARMIAADIIAAIGSDPRWGGLARWTDVVRQTIDVDQAGDVIAGVEIEFDITFRTPLWRM